MDSCNIKGREVVMNRGPKGGGEYEKKKLRIKEEKKRKQSGKKGREKTR